MVGAVGLDVWESLCLGEGVCHFGRGVVDLEFADLA